MAETPMRRKRYTVSVAVGTIFDPLEWLTREFDDYEEAKKFAEGYSIQSISVNRAIPITTFHRYIKGLKP